ncbi:hypothetical protein [Glaciihabitans sp. UYNi722]|uniref:hypothetical protein n=1 Tax=Glaciihabitans sp. UYNi722 TaxID=3156344 RepID=UPI0033970A80
MPAFERLDHVFVDESKRGDYYVAAAAVAPARAGETQRSVRQLTRPGQRRIHFKSENDSSRRSLLSAMSALDLRVQLYIVRGEPDKVSRTICLEALIADLAESGATRLTIERDESLIQADRRTIRDALHVHDYAAALSYEHAAPVDNAMLWVSDVVAWCYQAGGDWLRRVEPLVSGERRLR